MQTFEVRLTFVSLATFALAYLSSLVFAQQTLTLDFRAVVGDQDAACGVVYQGIGVENSSIELQDLRFYVSDLRLVTAAGEEVALELNQDGQWQYQNVALLDFENGAARCAESGNEATNSSVTGTVPAGDYTGLVFTLGVPFELNHADVATAPAPLNVSSMWWSWQGGYKHARIDLLSHSAVMMMESGEGTQDAAEGHGGEGSDSKHGGHGAVPAGLWPLHLGSTGGASDASVIAPDAPCANPNVVEVRLTEFDAETDVVVADVASLLGSVDVSKSLELAPPGCMSGPDDPDCAPVFTNLSLGGASSQTFFRSETKAE